MLQRFSEKIRICRERLGMTQGELAEKIGISRTHLNKIEQGKKLASLQVTLKLAEVLDVSTDVLMRDDLELDDGEDAA
jgi:transcriptional regulator with XRE-family HTH domain